MHSKENYMKNFERNRMGWGKGDDELQTFLLYTLSIKLAEKACEL